MFAGAMMLVGLFLVLYTVVFLLRAPDGSGKRRDSLGCGFVLLAGLVWSVALSQYLGDRSAGFRLGFAFAFVLPTLVAILRPGRRGIVGPAILLVCAVLLGATALPGLRARIRPSKGAATLQNLEATTEELRSKTAAAERYLEQLKTDRTRLAAEVRKSRHKDFDSIAADEQGMLLLKELAEVEGLIVSSETRLARYRADSGRMEAALRRIRRLAAARNVTGEYPDRAEVERILEEAFRPDSGGTPVTVEAHVEREELRALFERDVAQ